MRFVLALSLVVVAACPRDPVAQRDERLSEFRALPGYAGVRAEAEAEHEPGDVDKKLGNLCILVGKVNGDGPTALTGAATPKQKAFFDAAATRAKCQQVWAAVQQTAVTSAQ